MKKCRIHVKTLDSFIDECRRSVHHVDHANCVAFIEHMNTYLLPCLKGDTSEHYAQSQQLEMEELLGNRTLVVQHRLAQIQAAIHDKRVELERNKK